MRRRNVNFNLDDLDVPMLRDELMAAKFDEDTEPVSVGEGVVSPVAKREAAMLQDRSDWGNIGATLGQALGHNVPTKYWDSLAQRGQQTLADARSDAKTAELRKQFQDRIKAQADLQKQKIAAEQAAAEQKRGYELDDAAAGRSFEMEKLGAQRGYETESEKQRRIFEMSKLGKQQTFEATQKGLDRSNAIEAAKIRAAQENAERVAKRTEKLQEASIPGLEITPGAHPTADDAKKLKAAMTSQKNIETEGDKLGAIHRAKGTELFGADANAMDQALVAMKTEAKNVMELGALSGPDLELVNQIAGMDPTSFGANLKGMFGVDNTQDALKAFRQWAKDRVNNSMSTMGYRRVGGDAAPAQSVARKQGRDGNWYVKGPNGWEAE